MSNTNETASAWTRGLLGALTDRLLAWKLGLPAETCNYKVQPLRIPIHEDTSRIELAADLYQPILLNETKPAGTILVRCPYSRDQPFSTITARIFAARSYQILLVSCRGYYGSGGEFDPFRNEIEEGKAVVEWMRTQEWYTGTFVTLGASYLGFVQWALLMDPPHDMVAAIIGVAPHNFQQVVWGTGAFDMDWVSWAGMVSSQDESYHMLKMLLQPKRFRHVENGIPLAQTAEVAFKGKADWLQNWMKISDPDDDYYTPMKLDEALQRADIPILLISGWYDLFQEQTFEQYFRLREHGCNVALTVGDFEHRAAGLNVEANRDTLLWLDEHLAKKHIADREAPMKYYVTGAEEWRHTAYFPPTSNFKTLYLHGNNMLSTNPDIDGPKTSSFVFDPREPTPTVGGNNLGQSTGRVDDTALAERSDVLAFTTEPLKEDVEMIGRPTVELKHTTDIPYADLFVRISEVNEKGKSYNISEAYQRLNPKRGPEPITLSLSWCAHRFVKGKSIRLLIAGGSHPHYVRNLGVENPDNMASELKEVEHTIYHRSVMESRVTLL